MLLGAGRGAHLWGEGGRRALRALVCPCFSIFPVAQSPDVVMPDLTVDVSTDPTHSSSGGGREQRAAESSPEPSTVDRARAKIQARDSNPRGEGGAEFRVEVGDAYIRELSGGE